MSLELVNPQTGEITSYDPAAAKGRISKTDAVVNYAKDIKDWPLLEQAVDAKLVELESLVAWWRDNVRHAGKPIVAERGQLHVAKAQEITGFTKQQISKCARKLTDREKYKAAIMGAAYHKAMMETADTTAAKWTGDPESYTPAEYINAARRTMGAIDIDPASNDVAQETVQAASWFDREANGLAQEWNGRVFLNPPYSHPEIAQFIDKLCSEYQAGRVSAAVLLTNNNTDTKWWHQSAKLASAVCFTLGRINFYKEDGSTTQPTNGQTFFYFGPDPASFKAEFHAVGLVMVKAA